MGLEKALLLVDELSTKKVSKEEYKTIEENIINLISKDIKDELNNYSMEEINKSKSSIEDMFSLYDEIKNNNSYIVSNKIEIASKINKLHNKKTKWGLLDEEKEELVRLNGELENLNMELALYNHVVNFDINKTLQLYMQNKKIIYLLEMDSYITGGHSN